jgi:hypothetical protein
MDWGEWLVMGWGSVGRGYGRRVAAGESGLGLACRQEKESQGGKEEEVVRTASRNPRSNILFVVNSTLPVLRRL